MSDDKKKKDGELNDEELEEASGGVAGIHDQSVTISPTLTPATINPAALPKLPTATAPTEVKLPGTGKGGVMGVRG